MGVLVVAMADPLLGAGLGVEVEAGIDQVLRIREEEFHQTVPFDWT
jgi:hypothetical protein